jgi:hypothetical protein
MLREFSPDLLGDIRVTRPRRDPGSHPGEHREAA